MPDDNEDSNFLTKFWLIDLEGLGEEGAGTRGTSHNFTHLALGLASFLIGCHVCVWTVTFPE